MAAKCPTITVPLRGSREHDPFYVMGKVSRAMRIRRVDPKIIDAFVNDMATKAKELGFYSGEGKTPPFGFSPYIAIAQEWVNVE